MRVPAAPTNRRSPRHQARLRDHRLEPRRQRSDDCALRRIPAAIGSHSGRAAASHPSRAIGRHGVRGAAQALLSAASAGRSRDIGLLSDAQLESVICGEAHGSHLQGGWIVDETHDNLAAAAEDAENAVRFRRGWFLGDGTRAAKAVRSRGSSSTTGSRADAARSGSANPTDRGRPARLVGARPGASPRDAALTFPAGNAGAPSRGHSLYDLRHASFGSAGRPGIALQQLVDWLGGDFDGVIVFDESHAMQNAAGGKPNAGDQEASRRDGAPAARHALPRRPHPLRLGDGGDDGPGPRLCPAARSLGRRHVPLRQSLRILEAIEAGGVAAMEVLARDLKALGLYTAPLAFLQRRPIRNARASAGRRDPHLRRLCRRILGHSQQPQRRPGGRERHGRIRDLEPAGQSAARSAFESAKQRFFNHLITAMKAPTLIDAIQGDLAAGHASVIQLVSTGAALTERRLAEIPTGGMGGCPGRHHAAGIRARLS